MGACLTGCPAGIILGGSFLSSFVARDRITIKGEVDLAGQRGNFRVGAMRYFEGSEASAGYKLADVDGVDFGGAQNFSILFTGPATDSEPASGSYTLTLQSGRSMAHWLLIAWNDLNKNGKMEWEEMRAPETFQITKAGGNFFGFRASGSVLAPLATTGVVAFAEADKVKSYKFVFPRVEDFPTTQ
ncbi:MAG: hypothetical protein FJZ01_03205 [Candidatus Sericytochromatia bacterium]|nr:hypothetical protein [Candidatus Tanganyikabacteria bacterium]